MCERDIRLATINATLTERNLKPLAKLGDSSKGEIEVLSLAEIYDHSVRFFTDVKFAVRFPNGNEGAFTVRFNANGLVSDGAVMVVLINNLFAVVRQWRLPVARWTYEFPRGFGEKMDNASINGALGTLKIGDLPLGTLTRELSEEVMADAVVNSVTHLGNVAENSGTHAVTPSFYLVQLTVNPDKLSAKLKGSESNMAVKLWEPATLRDELGGKMCDCHSITAAALAMNYINRLPRL
ncbi:MAG: hypothetical protein P4L53_14405 [Candidatus Obscuribacterales bacterium]|nr:hypothetical protein [Candidatus Obscuribacterales bacterium]